MDFSKKTCKSNSLTVILLKPFYIISKKEIATFTNFITNSLHKFCSNASIHTEFGCD